MLVLTRRPNESIIIANNIKITVMSVGPGRVELGIESDAAERPRGSPGDPREDPRPRNLGRCAGYRRRGDRNTTAGSHNTMIGGGLGHGDHRLDRGSEALRRLRATGNCGWGNATGPRGERGPTVPRADEPVPPLPH